MTSAGIAAVAGSIKDIDAPCFLVPSRPTTATDANWRIIVTWKDTQPGFYDYYWGYFWDGSLDYSPYQYYQLAGFEAKLIEI